MVKTTRETAEELNRAAGRWLFSPKRLARDRANGVGIRWVRIGGRWYTTAESRAAYLVEIGLEPAGRKAAA